jgi:hypothetical protein
VRAVVRVWLPDGTDRPGCLEEVQLDVESVEPWRLVLAGLEVEDVRGGVDLTRGGTDLRFAPASGGGPLSDARGMREARAFGIVNAAYHVRRGLDRIEHLLGSSLPPLIVRIGTHRSQRPRWGGGHYRLPAATYAELPEVDEPSATGEIHLGCGRSYGAAPSGPYFMAPAHNLAILYHELGHHVTRHTADFRLNRLRPVDSQANHKIPLDEGTCDYLTGVLLGRPDIFGWHRARVPTSSMLRRRLDASSTMAAFRGGSDVDPHVDGTVWATALWATRTAVVHDGYPPETFDALVLDGLVRIGRAGDSEASDAALRRRRYFSNALAAILAADSDHGAGLASTIEASFAARGIRGGSTNAELRDRALAADHRVAVA